MGRRDTRLESEGAEFLVLGNMLLHGIPTHKSYTHTPGYDLTATWPTTSRSARIQVKSRWAKNSRGFFIRNFAAEFVVVVLLNRDAEGDESDPPEFIILPMSVVKRHYRNETIGKVYLPDIPRIDRYRDAWPLITRFLATKTTKTTRER